MSDFGVVGTWRRWAGGLRGNVGALYLALCDPQVPRTSKFVIVAVVAYALSPIDLIPDVIPILGLVDDLIIVPLGLMLAIRLMPAGLWADCQRRAAREKPVVSRSGTAAAIVLALWILAAGAVVYTGYALWAGEAPGALTKY